MKPVVTWTVLANARRAHVVANRGPGKGLVALEDKIWHAGPALEHSSRSGLGHSIAGPGVAAVEQSDTQHQADLNFAKEIVHQLEGAMTAREFDRLVIVAGPYMLGLLRQSLTKKLYTALLGEISKDLSALPLQSLDAHLGEVFAT